MHTGKNMRNMVLDQWRLIAAFMVILIHAPLPGISGQIAESLSRVAVPFFFLISGFYSFGRSADDLKRKAYRTLVLLLWSTGMYFLWEIIFSFYHGTTVQKLQVYFSLKTLFDTLVLNTGVLLGHLWFLLALLYCYLIYSCWMRKISYRSKLAVSIVLGGAFYLICYTLRRCGISDPVYYTRNFLFVGLPYFLAGSIICENKRILTEISVYAWRLVAFIGVAVVIAERLIIGCCDLYWGTPLVCIALFVMVQGQCRRGNKQLAAWGGKYSGDIYIFHVMVIGVINIAGSLFELLNNSVFLVFRPLVVLIMCIVVAVVKDRITMAVSRKT